jgi:6-phosphofructokinase 1
MKIKRIAITTGGGDCPGLNGVIRAVVKTATKLYDCEVVGIEDSFDGLIYHNRVMPLTDAIVDSILPRGGTMLGTTNRGNPLRYRVGDKSIDKTQEIVAKFKEHNIDGLINVGGDGSLAIGMELHKQGLPVIGVPKTIDNDLLSTDYTFGFDTAVNTVTDALDKLTTTTESHHRIMVVEVMGRNAGWIALHAGIAGSADMILIPEIPFSLQKITNELKNIERTAKKYRIIVVAEGAVEKGGRPMTQKMPDKDNIRLGGIGRYLADAIGEATGKETREVTLGHLQRGGSPTAFDRVLCSRLGVEAAHRACLGEYGIMVAVKGERIETVKLSEAIRNVKKVNPNGQVVKTAKSLGIYFGD